MSHRLLSATIFSTLALSLFACSHRGGNTVGDLTQKHIVVKKSSLPAIDTEKAMESYRSYLTVAPSTHPLYKEAINRLADLEMEEGDRKSIRDREETFRRARKVMENSDEVENDTNYENAIQLYQDLLKRNPDDERNQEVLYQLARAYEKSGNMENAISSLGQLNQQFPRNPYRVEALFRQGEMSFSLNQFEAAERAYREVVREGSQTQYYDRALYKHGWSLFKMEKYNVALLSFFALLDRMNIRYDVPGQIDQDALSRIEKDLLGDLFRSINLSFSYLGGVTAVEQYFSANPGRPYVFAIYENLGEYYIQTKRVKDAAEVFSSFVQHNPTHVLSPELQLRVVSILDNNEFATSALDARIEFVRLFNVQSVYWQKLSSAQKLQASQNLKVVLTQLITYSHNKAQKTRKAADVEATVSWYMQYVKSFPTDADTAAQWYLLGDLLYENNNYANAVVAYEKSAYGFPSHTKSVEAGYAALMCYEKLNASDPAIAARSFASAEKFVGKFPDDKRAVSIMARVAQRYFEQKMNDKALGLAQIILEKTKNTRDESQKTALAIVGHVNFDGGHFDEALVAYRRLIALGISDKGQEKTVLDRVAAATYRLAELNVRAGNKEEAAKQFERVAASTANRTISSKALYDAGATYMEIQRWPDAIRVLILFDKQYPSHELQQQVTEKLAFAYEQQGLYKDAAKAYWRLARASRDAKQGSVLLWKTAEYFEKAKSKSGAIAVYKEFVKTYPGELVLGFEARNKLVDLYAEIGQAAGRNFWVRSIVKDAAKVKPGNERLQYIVARAAFIEAEDSYEKFKRIALTVPLKRSLKNKKQAMEQAINAYADVTKHGVQEYATGATYRIASIYQELGKSLLASEKPKGLTQAEKEEYALLLEEQAYPFEEKAIKVFENNVALIQSGLYDDWIKKSLSALGQLQPARYAKRELTDGYVDALN